MPQYLRKPQVVEANQWFRNGDHPLDYAEAQIGIEDDKIKAFSGEERKARGWEGGVVRYFRDPHIPGDGLCSGCGRRMHDHGFIENIGNLGFGNMVCPGDFVITEETGVYSAMSEIAFFRTHQPVESSNGQ